MPNHQNDLGTSPTVDPLRTGTGAPAVGHPGIPINGITDLLKDVVKLQEIIKIIDKRTLSHEKTLNWIKQGIYISLGGIGVFIFFFEEKIKVLVKLLLE